MTDTLSEKIEAFRRRVLPDHGPHNEAFDYECGQYWGLTKALEIIHSHSDQQREIPVDGLSTAIACAIKVWYASRGFTMLEKDARKAAKDGKQYAACVLNDAENIINFCDASNEFLNRGYLEMLERQVQDAVKRDIVAPNIYSYMDSIDAVMKGDEFLRPILAAIPGSKDEKFGRYEIIDYEEKGDLSGRILWDRATPIAGFICVRSLSNTSRVLLWRSNDVEGQPS